MPIGKPKPQTKASEKYQKKVGYMTKGFKIKRELAEKFEEECRKAGVSPGRPNIQTHEGVY